MTQIGPSNHPFIESQPIHHSASVKPSPLVGTGGALGIAATLLGLAIFLVACFGFDAVWLLSPLPLVLGALGMVLTATGGVIGRHDGANQMQPIAALFVCLMGIICGAFELYLWMK